MTSWIDSHCHLDSLEDPAGAVGRALEAGVSGIVTVGTDLDTSRIALDIAARHASVRAVVGIHPHDAKLVSDEALERLAEIASNPLVVAIGETGLDYYRDLSPRPTQHQAFQRQIELAKRLGLALVIHMREAHDDVYRILREHGPPPALVFHCFSGGADKARRALDLGGCLSFAGNISYAKADDLREAALICPLDRLLAETDAPYLAPVPHRGKPNEPAYVVEVGRALAELMGRPLEEIAELTSTNARRVFRL